MIRHTVILKPKYYYQTSEDIYHLDLNPRPHASFDCIRNDEAVDYKNAPTLWSKQSTLCLSAMPTNFPASNPLGNDRETLCDTGKLRFFFQNYCKYII